MKKIPTLFKREFISNHDFILTEEVTDGMERILQGDGVATIKQDGAACAIINGVLYRRYDAKKGKKVPKGAIPCQEKPDEVTGHFPHWLKCEEDNPADKWYIQAYKNTIANAVKPLADATYEAVGVHFQGNPYKLSADILLRHGQEVVEVDRSFNGIKLWLMSHPSEEGLVFWLNGEPVCKIRQKDYHLKWIGSKEF